MAIVAGLIAPMVVVVGSSEVAAAPANPAVAVADAPEAPEEIPEVVRVIMAEDTILSLAYAVGLGDNIVASAPPAVVTSDPPIVATDVTALEAAAIALWDIGTATPTYTVSIVDLEGTRLARVVGTVIEIDGTAAGHGWHVDGLTDPAADEMDLLTVLAHEFGHLLGFADLDPSAAESPGSPATLMTRVLVPGVRRVAPGPTRWTPPINGAATISDDGSGITVGGITVDVDRVSNVVVVGGPNPDTLTVSGTISKGVTFSGGSGADVLVGSADATTYGVSGSVTLGSGGLLLPFSAAAAAAEASYHNFTDCQPK